MGATGVLPRPGGVPSASTTTARGPAMPTPRARRPFRRRPLARRYLAARHGARPRRRRRRPVRCSSDRRPTPLRGDRHRHRSRAQRRQCRERRADRPQGLDRDDVEAVQPDRDRRRESGFAEHRFNLLVSQAVKTRLEALGATVRMTRTTNDGWGPCVDVRGTVRREGRARPCSSASTPTARPRAPAASTSCGRPASTAGPTTSSARRRGSPRRCGPGCARSGCRRPTTTRRTGIKTRTRPGHAQSCRTSRPSSSSAGT